MSDRVRDELARRAQAVDVSATARERVLRGVRPRRRWARPVLGASLAVAATVAGIALVTRDVPTRSLVDPDPADSSPTQGAEPDRWRTEYWRDVQVEVPADWWYGGGALGSASSPSACFPEPMVSPSGSRGDDADAAGYVGRPIYLTDVCLGDADTAVPQVPSLWFDPPLETGTVELGEGWVRETVAVNGSRISVATQDAALRQQILASATGGETCLANRDDLADPWTEPQPTDERGPVVCAYRAEGREAWLSYAAPLADGQVRDFTTAFEAAPAWVPDGRECDLGGPGSEWVVLHVDAATYVVHPGWFGCPVVSSGDKVVELTPALVEPWATGGIPAVVQGPTGGKGAMLDSFIGPMG
jgi:hypothetical protein